MNTWSGSHWKPSRTARRKATVAERLKREQAERAEKAKVRRRDRVCRFPLCGCRRLGLPLEVSHDQHKGHEGAQTKRAVSVVSRMVLLCRHRHQDGVISMHHGTLRARPLTAAGYNGPVEWLIDVSSMATSDARRWSVIARERVPGQLEPRSEWQSSILERLQQMDR